LQQQFEHDAEYVFRRRFVVDLIDHLNLPMPDRFLKRWILASNEQPLTEEQLDREYPAYSQSLRWELLQGAIMRDQDIRINREDIVEEAKDILRGQYEKYGLPVDDATLTGYAEEIFAKEDDRRRLIDRIVERRVVDALKEKVTIESKAVSFEEFGKLLASVR
jgi:trigger factor